MNPLLTDSITLLFLLSCKPDVMMKRDSVWRVLGCDHQNAVDAAAPLIQRAWIQRHLQGDRQNTIGHTITDAGITAARSITDRTNQAGF
jgi:hypothetical protein